MTQIELEIVMDMLGTCEVPPAVEVETMGRMVVKVGEHKPSAGAGPEGPVYGSCEEAACRR